MLHILLPAYNEETALTILLPRIRHVVEQHRLTTQIIVVDDGSTDRTGEIARTAGADQVLIHSQNKGLAAALETGLSHLVRTAAPEDVIVTLDADNTHNPGLIPRMVQRIEEGYDVVIASRFQTDARVVGVPPVRQLLSNAGGWIYRIMLPIRGVRDYTCGYRAYRVAILQTAFERWEDQFITEAGFAAMVDILLKLRRIDDVLMVELPFILRYDQKPGPSKMDVGANITASLKLAFRRALGRLD